MSHGQTKKSQRGLAQCPHCETYLAAPLEAAGKMARCKSCDQRFRIPAVEDLFEDAVAYIVEREESERSRQSFDQASKSIRHDAIRGVEIG